MLGEFAPPEAVSAAASAGFAMVGVWFDPGTWSAGRAREVRRRLDATGLVALDMEPVFVTPEGDGGERLIDAAAEVGARNVLTVSRGGEPERFADRFGELCDHAAPAGITVVIEPTVLYSVRTLAEAVRVVALADRPNGGILADNLHLARAGGNPPQTFTGRSAGGGPLEVLQRLDPALLPYAQLCDAPATPADDSPAGLADEARNERRLLGKGDLPVRQFVAALPARIPLSLEIRSRWLRERHPDAAERAARVHANATRYLVGQAAVGRQR